LLSSHNDGPGFKIDFLWGLKAEADHYPLFEHDIPVLLFHTGVHKDYHRSTDLAKFINRRGMMEITRMVFGVVYELANGPTTPAFRAAARHETPETEKSLLDQIAKPAERLGVGWIEDAAVSGGVVVSSVAPGSPADRAGLRVGDCIVRVAGRDIRSDDDFFGAVAQAASPASFTVKRTGEQKPLDVTATLAGSPLRWGMTWRVDDAEPGAVILTHVVRGSPAARAGLAAGDRIYQVGGRDFADEAAFVRLTKRLSESLPLLVERDGRLRSVTLQSRQTEPLKRAA
jgi:C-terminal processing protease CtpA/Prc